MSDPAQPASPGTSGRLLKILGVGFGVAVAIGNTIAAGIVRTPGDIAEWLPNVYLFLGVWVLGGLYALLGANALAELGAMIPRSGGQYPFSRRAFGDYVGFIVGWSDWLSTCGSLATAAFVIGEYSDSLIPALAGRQQQIAIGVTVLFALLQWRGLRWGSRTQNFASLLKGAGFLVLAGACFLMANRLSPPPVEPPSPTAATLIAVILALQAVIYTYDGWSGPVYFGEEERHPARDIPRGLFLGCLSIMGIYLALNAALVYALPIDQIAGHDFALGLAATTVFGHHGEMWARWLMVLSLLAGINAYHLMASRVLFGLSRDGLCPAAVARLNSGGTPTVALCLGMAIAAFFILWSGTFQRLIAVMSFFFVANYVMSFAALFVLRIREPNTPRPFRAWGHPWTTGLALVGSLTFLAGAVISDSRNSVWALALLAASYPVYRFTRRTYVHGVP